MASALEKLFSDAPWMKYAWEEARKGVKEIKGTGKSKTNADILKYLESVTNEIGRKSYLYIPVEEKQKGIGSKGLKGDEIAWCSAFVNWCIEQAGLVGRDHLGAKRWENWANGKKITDAVPVPGAITILSRGHVGFLLFRENGKVHMLGGNQSDMVCIAAYDASGVECYMWPTAYEMSLNRLMTGSYYYDLYREVSSTCEIPRSNSARTR